MIPMEHKKYKVHFSLLLRGSLIADYQELVESMWDWGTRDLSSVPIQIYDFGQVASVFKMRGQAKFFQIENSDTIYAISIIYSFIECSLCAKTLLNTLQSFSYDPYVVLKHRYKITIYSTVVKQILNTEVTKVTGIVKWQSLDLIAVQIRLPAFRRSIFLLRLRRNASFGDLAFA